MEIGWRYVIYRRRGLFRNHFGIHRLFYVLWDCLLWYRLITEQDRNGLAVAHRLKYRFAVYWGDTNSIRLYSQDCRITERPRRAD